MSITLLLSFIYLYWASIPDAPFGKKEVRGLLVARGVGGFFGGTYGSVYGKRVHTKCRCSVRILL